MRARARVRVCACAPKAHAHALCNPEKGSASFHVNWTGVAEVAGGAGVLLGALPPVAEAVPSLGPTAALGLFWLTWAVTPANIYMATHNAPGPGPAGAVIPAAGHAVRGLLQVFLLSVLWGLAHPQ